MCCFSTSSTTSLSVGNASSLYDAEVELLALQKAALAASAETWIQRAEAEAAIGEAP